MKGTAIGQLEASRIGIKLIKLFGISKEDRLAYPKKGISCDVFQIANGQIAGTLIDRKRALIKEMVDRPKRYGENEGYHYGFVESKTISEEVIYGYFAQEYWDLSLKYPNSFERIEKWDTRYTNLLYIWPVKFKCIYTSGCKVPNLFL